MYMKQTERRPENRNLSQNIANCDKQECKDFTLSPEEVEIVNDIVAKVYLDMQYLIKTYKNDKLYVKAMRGKATILDNLLTRIKHWQDEKG